MELDDGNKYPIVIKVLSITNSIIFLVGNLNKIGIHLILKFKPIPNMEFVGPNGKVS